MNHQHEDPFVPADQEPLLTREEFFTFEEASKGQRFVHYLVDTLVYFGLAVLAGVFFELTGLGFILEEDSGYDLIFSITLMLGYFWLMEGLTGKTVGKMLTRTHVVTMEGNQPTMRNILVRSLCRFIPLDAISFLGSGGWHDSISQTLVVKDIQE